VQWFAGIAVDTSLEMVYLTQYQGVFSGIDIGDIAEPSLAMQLDLGDNPRFPAIDGSGNVYVTLDDGDEDYLVVLDPTSCE
jgi:hypothetical protein